MNVITHRPLMVSAGLGGVSREFARRFAGLDRLVEPARTRWPEVNRGRHGDREPVARMLWSKIRDGKIADPVSIAALRREHAAAFARFDSEQEEAR